MKAEASARKAGTEYKPIIKIGTKTTVIEQSPERSATYTKHGRIEGNKYARGTTYATREEAIAAASAYIALRLKETRERFERLGKPAKMQRELELWGD